jgi:hypothetical protein
VTPDLGTLFTQDFLRPERRGEIVAILRAMNAPNGQKRSLYLRWLLFAKVDYQAGDLDEVITTRRRAAPTAEELR